MSAQTFWTSYQINPIYLVNGAAGGGLMAISQLLNAAAYSNGYSSPSSAGTSDTFGQFRLLPGGTLIDNELAEYPFANMTTAADAVITRPLVLSLEMLVPADDKITLSGRLSIMTNLVTTLQSHIAQGGSFNVQTPSYIYQNCLLLNIADTSELDIGSQPQTRWQWNFRQPLITIEAAQAVQNQALAKISAQTQNAGDPPGSQAVQSGIGQSSSGAAVAVAPSVPGSGAGAPTSNATNATPVNPNANGIQTQVSLW